MAKPLVAHPIAALFPDLHPTDFAALKEDIRRHGVKAPILLHGGQILDGRQRYRACRELGLRVPFVEWNGHDPWLEVQSRNLLRRQLAKEQVYAIRKLAAQQFPEIAALFDAERANAHARKTQAKGKPRGQKVLTESSELGRPSADAIGAQVGVSGSTVKRVDRLAREAPHLLPRVAAGELSVRHALRALAKPASVAMLEERVRDRPNLIVVERVINRLEHVIREEWMRCPPAYRADLLRSLKNRLQKLLSEEKMAHDVRMPESLGLRDSIGIAAMHIGDPMENGARVRFAGG
jgi:ParB-like chromosome segregation protein Spo0J